MVDRPLNYCAPAVDASRPDPLQAWLQRRKISIVVVVCGGWAAVCVAACVAAWKVGLLSDLNGPQDPTWTTANIEASERAGDRIVAALERHKTATGRYPATLAELVPAELSGIVTPSAGTGRWEYGASAAGDGFDLNFQTSSVFPMGDFNSATPRWKVITPSDL